MRSLASFGFSLVLLLASIGVGHASEAQLRDAYAAYQVAADAGDLHGALPHAQRAYELGLELYGPESRDFGLLALNLGKIQNGLVLFEQASVLLELALGSLRQSGLASPDELHETYHELALSYLAQRRGTDAQDLIDTWPAWAAEFYGPETIQAAEISYLTGLLVLFEHPLVACDRHFCATWGTTSKSGERGYCPCRSDHERGRGESG